MINKRGMNKWIWILIVVVIVIIIGIIAYSLMSGNGGSILGGLGGNSIPQPPALPSG